MKYLSCCIKWQGITICEHDLPYVYADFDCFGNNFCKVLRSFKSVDNVTNKFILQSEVFCVLSFVFFLFTIFPHGGIYWNLLNSKLLITTLNTTISFKKFAHQKRNRYYQVFLDPRLLYVCNFKQIYCFYIFNIQAMEGISLRL